MKTCPKCGVTKPTDEFVRNRSAKDGVGAYCRPCHNAMGRANKLRRWGGHRFYHLKARYGLDKATFERLDSTQGGLCAICRRNPAAHVDHDHTTGRVRGLLCFRCNGGLGQFNDDPMTLAMAIAYLDRATRQSQPVSVPDQERS